MKPTTYDASNRLTTACHTYSTWTYNTNNRRPFISSYVFNSHANQIYPITTLTDSTGGMVERYTYDPYGKATILAADGVTVRTASAVGNPWTFTGRRLNGETGLMYYRARMFDTGLGRFVGRDPIKYKGSKWNLYRAFFVPKTMDPESGELISVVNDYTRKFDCPSLTK